MRIICCWSILSSSSPLFFFNDTATPEIYTLSLTTLFRSRWVHRLPLATSRQRKPVSDEGKGAAALLRLSSRNKAAVHAHLRSEEHTSELQSHSDLVCRLLLEKKKHNNATDTLTSPAR